MKKFNQLRIQRSTKFYKNVNHKFEIGTRPTNLPKSVEIGWYFLGFMILAALLIFALK